ncbi:MAG: secretion protein [Bacteroidetes bacterium]|nr:MAG: secretion protein [Bacteroidota bacterium]
MKKTYLLIHIFILHSFLISAQDTFSIVAIDSITGEVGSAGASCVDLFNWPGFSDHFLGELFPGTGAINTQAYYNETNQANARNRMNLGDTPSEIITWLIENDVSSQPQLRQYGIVAFANGSPESAAHTGTQTDDYKNHVLGPNYSMQGNILLGQVVLDSMESRFLNAEGNLACKLMAALQGAKMVGADSRCADNGTSSLFAFVKVAQPSDVFGSPSFILSVRTHDNSGIEPIDSLQVLFDEVVDCSGPATATQSIIEDVLKIYPNPCTQFVKIDIQNKDYAFRKVLVRNMFGQIIFKCAYIDGLSIDMRPYKAGIYLFSIQGNEKTINRRVLKLSN